MIDFDEINDRLKGLEKDRAWLAKESNRSAESIRSALAPNAPPNKRSTLLQRILSDAIEREEAERVIRSIPEPLGYRVYLEPTPAQFDAWMAAAYSVPGRTFDMWAYAGLDAIAAREIPFFVPPASSEVHWIDLCGGIAAGEPISCGVPAEPVKVAKKYPSDFYGLRVFGHSMEPKIPDGALIVVQRLPDGFIPKQGEIVVYSDAYGLALKKFSYRKAQGDETANAFGRVAVLKSINPHFPEISTLDGGKIVAVLVDMIPAG